MDDNIRIRTALSASVVTMILSVVILFWLTGIVNADVGEYRHREYARYREYMDSRYHHNHYYPSRGEYVTVLPAGYRVYHHRGARYYFHGGVWYRAYGPRFVVVAPPIGLFIPVLPPYYATIWVGGVPYYYANEVYYAPAPGGYVVVEPPKGEVVEAPPADQLYIYPRRAQSAEQQAKDRYECHRWAVNQTGYDPTQPPAGVPAGQKRADYQRAMGACLDARGYTVK
ncbi:MAG: DUF6515 family protein [Syntrophales bacterium]